MRIAEQKRKKRIVYVRKEETVSFQIVTCVKINGDEMDANHNTVTITSTILQCGDQDVKLMEAKFYVVFAEGKQCSKFGKWDCNLFMGTGKRDREVSMCYHYYYVVVSHRVLFCLSVSNERQSVIEKIPSWRFWCGNNSY